MLTQPLHTPPFLKPVNLKKMEYLIATIVIMLFCITALAQEKSPESAIIISRDKPKPLKTSKVHVKQMTKHICAPAFTNLPEFTGQLCLDVVPINGGRAVSLYLPAWYGAVMVLRSPRQNHYAPDILVKQVDISQYGCCLSPLNLFGKVYCFVIKKLQLS